jgi:hypothetical protein
MLATIDNTYPPVFPLDDRCQTFDPVAVIAVKNPIDIADLCMVNMTADHAVYTAAPGLTCDSALKIANVTNRALDLQLQEF